MHWNTGDLEKLERRYRGNLINSIGGYKSLLLVGTQSSQGNNNLAIFSSYFHIGADPALCGMVVRPAEETENTLGNILQTGHYTLNHVLPSFYEKAHQCSAKYPAGVSEFERVGLTPHYMDAFKAPFVAESSIKMGCEFVQKMDIALNGTTIIIGRIVFLEAPDDCILDDGSIDLNASQTVTCSGLDTYHIAQRLGKLPYAKSEK